MFKKKGVKRMSALLLSAAMLSTVLVAPANAQDGVNAPMPYGLLTNELEKPLNVEAPTFSWWNQDADLDDVQTAYQIIVKDDLTDEVVWDSNKVESSEQSNIPYTGPELDPAHPYSWTVTTWDSTGLKGTSEPASFATGLSDEDWNASWIQKPGTPVTIESSGTAAHVQGGGLTMYSAGTGWANYNLNVDVNAEKGAAGVAFRAADSNNAYIWSLVPGKGLTKTALVNGEKKDLGTVEMDIMENAYYSMNIVANGNTITTSIDGIQIDVTTDETFASGTVGFYEEEGQAGKFEKLSVISVASVIDSIYVAGTKDSGSQIILNDQGYDWTDYTIDFDAQINNTSKDATGVMLRSTSDFKTGYMWNFTRNKGGLARHTMTNGKFNKLDGSSALQYSFKADTYYHFTIELKGNTIKTYINGELFDTYVDENNTSMKGTFGFRHAEGEGGTYKNIKVTAADGTELLVEDFQNLDHYKFSNGTTASTIKVNDNTETYLSADFSKGFDGWSNTTVMNQVDGNNWANCNTNGVILAKTGTDWDNYTVSMRVIAEKTAAGIMFRATDKDSGYMWQIVPGTGLKVHVQENGKFTALKDPIKCDIKQGQAYRVTIDVNGDTFKTYINGTLVDTTTDSTYSKGTIGFRESTTGTEVGKFSEVKVTGADGTILLEDKFDNGMSQWNGDTVPATGSNMYWYARKEEKLEEGKEPVKALAYMASAHDYELSINGTRIGRGQSFDYSDETHYQGWDITEALGDDDTISIGVLDRWYSGGQGRAAGKPGLLGEIVVYYNDGSYQTISTGEDWVAEEAPLSGSSKRNGEGDFIEEYDARKAIDNYSEVGFDDSSWKNVYVLGEHPTDPFTNVNPELGHVTEEENVKPETVTTLEDGTTIVDFGRVIPARFSIDFANGTAGQKLTLTTGYELKEDGKVNTSNSSTQNTKMTFIYTQKDGAQTYNTWDHLAFRYLQIPNVGQTFTKDDITATILYQEVPEDRDSTLITSDEMLNQVYQLMKDSALYSAQNQFVDTPTREKGQFLQDSVNISAITTTSLYERATSRKAIMQFFDSANRYWNSGDDLGRYNSVYPNVDNKRDIPDFSLNVPIWIWRYYMQTGDRELLEVAYPYLQNTADYATRAIATEGATAGLVTNLPGGSGEYKYGIVDWPSPGRFDYDMDAAARTTVNALSVRVFDVVADVAQELGKDAAEVQDYTTRAENLKKTMNEKLITEDGVYCDGLMSDGTQSTHNGQHSTSYALAFGIAPEDKIDSMVDYVASMGMKQGPMTADILVQALFDNGRADAALKLLTNTEDYGWAQLIDQYDATFTWEQWQHGQSQSHGWGAAAGAEMLENILGVTVTEAGAKTVTIDPARDILDHAEGRFATERGFVEVAYSGSGEDYTLKVTVPTNVEATVVLPKIEGGYFVDKNGNSGTSTFTETEQLVTVGGGTREFVFQQGANKGILNTVIDYAQQQKDSDEFNNVIADVQASFTAALDNAIAVRDNTTATQKEVDAAWQALMTEIHKLGFVKGDITSLETLVSVAEGFDLSKYVEAGQAEFKEALKAAQDLIADKDNAMEAEIQTAENNLLNTMLNLRLKADKSILEEMIATANGMDANAYTSESYSVLTTALAKANDVMADDNATQEDVDAAANAVKAAMDGLVAIDGTEVQTPSTENNATQAGQETTTTKANAAKTGDIAVPAAVIGLLAASAVAVGITKKRKK